MSQIGFTNYNDEALALALALANCTHAQIAPGVWEPEGLRSREHLRALIMEHGWVVAADALGPDEVAAARILRDRLRSVFHLGLADPALAVSELDTLLDEARPRPGLRLTDDGTRIELSADPAGSLIEQLTTLLSLAVARAAEQHGIERFRRCADAPATGNACTTVFIDTSKNGRSRFCRPQCASRTHVAAFRRREREHGLEGSRE